EEAGFAQASSKCLHQMRGVLGGPSAEISDHRHRRLLRARRERPRHRCAAEQRDELAPFQLIEEHSVPSQAGAGLQDIELARISQEVTERFYNLLAGGEGGRCPIIGWSGRAPAPPAIEAGK